MAWLHRSTLWVFLLLAASFDGAFALSRRLKMGYNGTLLWDSMPGMNLTRATGGVLCYNNRAIPNAFLIGGQKCGSSSLYFYLIRQACTSIMLAGIDEYGRGAVLDTKKEKHFLDRLHVRLDTHDWFDAYSQYYPSCDEEDGIKSGAVRYVVDGTPDYMQMLSASLDIGAHYARIGVRQELKFLVSGRHVWGIPCTMDFNDWVKSELPKELACMQEKSSLSKQQMYNHCGMKNPPPYDSPFFASWYALQLEPWFSLFPPAQHFLVIDFENYDTPEGARKIGQQVMDFLGVEYELPVPDVMIATNVGERWDKCKSEPEMTPETERILRNFFAPFNTELIRLFRRYDIEKQLPRFVKLYDSVEED
eukprot:jgi/Chlat1/8858/Chrsp91S08157